MPEWKKFSDSRKNNKCKYINGWDLKRAYKIWCRVTWWEFEKYIEKPVAEQAHCGKPDYSCPRQIDGWEYHKQFKAREKYLPETTWKLLYENR